MKPTIIRLTDSNEPIRVISQTFKQVIGEDGSDELFANAALSGYDDEVISNFSDEQINNIVDEVSSSFDAEEEAEFDAQESYFDDNEFSYSVGKRKAKKAARKQKRQSNKVARRNRRIEKLKVKRANAKSRVLARQERKGVKLGKRLDKKAIRKDGRKERKVTRKGAKNKRKGRSEETPNNEMTDGSDINDAGTADYEDNFQNRSKKDLSINDGKEEVIDTPIADVIEPSENEEGKFMIFDLIGHLTK